jgi:prepilin-type N-terminal cleavage/methylation domain-containing protein
MFINNYKKFKSAFSLIEVMVVIAILSLGMLSIAGLVRQSIRAENVSKTKLLSQELAQEGLEMMRRIRDNNFIAAGFQGNSPDWLTGIEPGNSYKISFLMDEPILITSIEEGRLQIINNGYYEGFYTHNPIYPDSNFYRKIDVETVAGEPDAVRLISTVMWQEAGYYADYSLETILYDWY